MKVRRAPTTKTTFAVALLLAALSTNDLLPKVLLAEGCKDEESMVGDAKKSVSEMAGTVKKESLQDFENRFHQKSSLSKLKFCRELVDGLVACLDQASKDPTATKEQLDAFKSKRESYAKLKDKLDQEQGALSKAADPKNAKTLIEKLDLSD